MTEPEPQSGYARDDRGVIWYRDVRGGWRSAKWGLRDQSVTWNRAVADCGPMVPMLPAARSPGVPDSGWPMGVTWGAWIDGKLRSFTPNGTLTGTMTAEDARALGYEVRAAEPLSDRLAAAAAAVESTPRFSFVGDPETSADGRGATIGQSELAGLLREAARVAGESE